MQDPAPDTFFTDEPLPEAADGWYAMWQAKWERMRRWSGYTIVGLNGHVVWKRPEDVQPDDLHVFYDGDYSNVLAPDDPRILIPAEDPPSPPRLEWDD